MATQTWTGALTALQTITSEFDTWVVAADCTITVASGNGISDTAAISGATLEIDGSITASLGSGVNLSGDNYTIQVITDSSVDAKYGIVLGGSGSTLTNHGDIVGSTDGIYESGGNNEIINKATISGGYGVEVLGAGTSLINGTGGVIDGSTLPVWFGNTSGKTSFVNEGLVKGGFQSIGADYSETNVSNTGQTTVTNKGTIESAVYLGDGNDTFINKGGVCEGAVDLEHGSDLYVIDKTSIFVSEADKGNKGDVDTVKASVSCTLGDNIDYLVLTGSRNLSATGNSLANQLTGNSGDNSLDGKGGDDRFIFKKGCGDDTIDHFANKHDRVDLSGYKGVDAWTDIKGDISTHRGDTVIDLGHGDTITFDGIAQSKINAADFIF